MGDEDWWSRLKLNASEIEVVSVGLGKQLKEFVFIVPPHFDISAHS